MAKNFSFSFFLNTNPNKKKSDGRFPIYCRIIVNRKKSEIALDKFLLEKDWDSNKQRAKKDLLLNEEINAISEKISVIKRTLDKDNEDYDAKTIKDIVSGKEKTEYYLIEYFQNIIDFKSQDPTLKSGTISRYKDTLAHIKDFIRIKKNTSDLLIKKANSTFVNEFELYLLNYKIPSSTKTLERNTVNKHLVRLKTIFIKAHQEGIILKSPFEHIKLKYTPSKREFLTQEELDKIMKLDLSDDLTAEKIRDTFIWQVYTGMRYEDAINVSMNQIKKAKDGKFTIAFKQSKTSESINIPLLPPAFDIIKKYHSAEREITDKVLPKTTNQQANRILKFIGRLAEIKKPLTTHIARHTCATTILLSNNASIEAVSQWLGHTNIKTTQIYAKITNQYLQETANKIESKIFKKK